MMNYKAKIIAKAAMPYVSVLVFPDGSVKQLATSKTPENAKANFEKVLKKFFPVYPAKYTKPEHVEQTLAHFCMHKAEQKAMSVQEFENLKSAAPSPDYVEICKNYYPEYYQQITNN